VEPPAPPPPRWNTSSRGGYKLEECKSLTKRLGLENKVYFPGLLTPNELLQCYRTCQIALVPTNTETFGYCIAEPYILGKVVISRRTGISEDIIIPGETGFLFDTEEELLEILIDILPDKERSAYVANNAFKNRDIFRWDNICEKYLRMINDL
jgi:glycosyltransferase involved in cell wall biosynthesis